MRDISHICQKIPGYSEQGVERFLPVARCVIQGKAEGMSKVDICRDLVDAELIPPELADQFFEEALFAAELADKLRSSEDWETVIIDTNYTSHPPYMLAIALHLAAE